VAAPLWEPPGEFEEYRLVRPLGAGTMGRVYLAHDTLLDRPVAIKFVGSFEVGPAARERFFTEARAVARLSHANVVAIHRVGEVRRRPYLVSEFVDGTSLDRLTKPIPWQRALRIAVGLAQGLAAAHRHGVLHRDLKPANVVLGADDTAKLLDFGLAKLLDAAAGSTPPVPVQLPDTAVDATASLPGRAAADSPLEAPHHTAAGARVGTPLYLAPELWRGEPATPRTDVYAFGVLLHELLAGRAPHAGVPLAELRRHAETVDPAPIPGLPPLLAELLSDCTSRDPARRPASGVELASVWSMCGPAPRRTRTAACSRSSPSTARCSSAAPPTPAPSSSGCAPSASWSSPATPAPASRRCAGPRCCPRSPRKAGAPAPSCPARARAPPSRPSRTACCSSTSSRSS
jgi:serine/threonine protein kinase